MTARFLSSSTRQELAGPPPTPPRPSSLLRKAGATNIAAACRHLSRHPGSVLPINDDLRTQERA